MILGTAIAGLCWSKKTWNEITRSRSGKVQYRQKCPCGKLSQLNIGCETNDFIHRENRDTLEGLDKK